MFVWHKLFVFIYWQFLRYNASKNWERFCNYIVGLVSLTHLTFNRWSTKKGDLRSLWGERGAHPPHLSPYGPAIAALCNNIMTSSQKFILNVYVFLSASFTLCLTLSQTPQTPHYVKPRQQCICGSASLALRNICRVRKYLDQTSILRCTRIHSSWLDFCSSLSYGLPAKETWFQFCSKLDETSWNIDSE